MFVVSKGDTLDIVGNTSSETIDLSVISVVVGRAPALKARETGQLVSAAPYCLTVSSEIV